MAIEELGFGGLRFEQPGGLYRFGCDALLLADFARFSRGDTLCDLCTGTGIVPIILASSGKACEYHGVELMPDAADAARRNAALNSLPITIHTADLRQHAMLPFRGKAALVTANPPYFSAKLPQSPNLIRRVARSRSECEFDDVAEAAEYMLKFGGRFTFIYRPDMLCDAMCALRKVRLEPKRLRFVSASRAKPPFAFLAEAKKGASGGLTLLPPLFLDTDADEARRIYHAGNM